MSVCAKLVFASWWPVGGGFLAARCFLASMFSDKVNFCQLLLQLLFPSVLLWISSILPGLRRPIIYIHDDQKNVPYHFVAEICFRSWINMSLESDYCQNACKDTQCSQQIPCSVRVCVLCALRHGLMFFAGPWNQCWVTVNSSLLMVKQSCKT